MAVLGIFAVKETAVVPVRGHPPPHRTLDGVDDSSSPSHQYAGAIRPPPPPPRIAPAPTGNGPVGAAYSVCTDDY